jgi:Tol biopolymer transport system component
MRHGAAAAALAGALLGCTSGPSLDRTTPLVWTAQAGGDSEVFARVDGTDHRLTKRLGSDFAGPVSPDGQRVLVIHSNDQETGHEEQLWAHPLPGQVARPLAVSTVATKVRSPTWAPDGSVVYESDAESFRDLYRATPGQPPARLTRSPHGCYEPTVAGEVVVHVCSGSDPDLWTVPLAGGPARPLLRREGEDLAPTVSPDGVLVAFLAGSQGRLSLWTVGLDGTGAQERWRSPLPQERIVAEQGLVWSPDGARIALVVRDGDGKPGVRVVDWRTGAEVLRVAGELPRWTAKGQLIWTHEDGAGLGVFRLDEPGGPVRLTAPGGWLGWPL